MLEVIVKKVNKEEVIVTSTLDVAETFCKEHKDLCGNLRGYPAGYTGILL